MPHLIATPFDYEFIITPEKVWIVIDELPMRIAMHAYAWRAATLSLIVDMPDS